MSVATTTYGTREEALLADGDRGGGGGVSESDSGSYSSTSSSRGDRHRMFYVVVVRLLDGVKVATFHDFKVSEGTLRKADEEMVKRSRNVVGTKVIPKLLTMTHEDATRASLTDADLRITFVTGPLCAFICVTSLEYPAETAFAAMKSLRGKLEALRASRDVDVEQCRAKALNKPLKLSFDELRDKYSSALQTNAILRAQEAVKQVTAKMEENIEKALLVVADTTSLMENADELNSETESTRVETSDWRKRKACCCSMFNTCCGRRQCLSKCFMTFVSLFFVLLGLGMTALAAYTYGVLNFGGENVLQGYTAATVLALLLTGIILAIVSGAVWASTLKPTAFCSKLILIIFSVVLLAVFVAQVCVMILALAWIGDITVNIDGVDTDQLFNATVDVLYRECCATNATTVVHDVCDHILGAQAVYDCSAFEYFADAVVQFIEPLIKYIGVFGGIVALLELLAFVCSCCLLGTAKRAKSRSFVGRGSVDGSSNGGGSYSQAKP